MMLKFRRSNAKSKSHPLAPDSSAAELPNELLEDILAGNVVAFVGAGFSAPSDLPLWDALLRDIAQCSLEQGLIKRKTHDAAVRLARDSSCSSSDLDLSAQILSDSLGADEFEQGLRERVRVPSHSRLPPVMKERLRLLQGIPFAAIVTTNFDGLLVGPHVTDAQDPRFGDFAAQVLRQPKSEFERMENVAFRKTLGVPIVKLHGDAQRKGSKLVCSRKAYRELLHGSTQYSTFVRTLLATRTVLFLGFSFTDAYINEFRSEVSALFGGQQTQHPLSYALLPDVGQVERESLLRNDNMVVLGFNSNQGNDFSGFDAHLSELHRATNPVQRFGRLLDKRRILWLHDDWKSSRDTRFLKEFLEKANEQAMGAKTCDMVVVETAGQGLEALNESVTDVLVCCYDSAKSHGTSAAGRNTLDLLKSMRDTKQVKDAVPTVVFGAVGHAERRAQVIRFGARDYTGLYYTLLENIAHVLEAFAQAD